MTVRGVAVRIVMMPVGTDCSAIARSALVVSSTGSSIACVLIVEVR